MSEVDRDFYSSTTVMSIPKLNSYRHVENWLDDIFWNVRVIEQYGVVTNHQANQYANIINNRPDLDDEQKDLLIELCHDYINSDGRVKAFVDLKEGMFFKCKDGRTYVILYTDGKWWLKCHSLTLYGSECSWDHHHFEDIVSWSDSYGGMYKRIRHGVSV
jgi:hypothetical protein